MIRGWSQILFVRLSRLRIVFQSMRFVFSIVFLTLFKENLAYLCWSLDSYNFVIRALWKWYMEGSRRMHSVIVTHIRCRPGGLQGAKRIERPASLAVCGTTHQRSQIFID